MVLLPTTQSDVSLYMKLARKPRQSIAEHIKQQAKQESKQGRKQHKEGEGEKRGGATQEKASEGIALPPRTTDDKRKAVKRATK